MNAHRESPTRRVNPSGQVVWVARCTTPDGKRRSVGTFKRKGPCKTPSPSGDCCAQHAIDAAYERPVNAGTLGAYAATWTKRHPRSNGTNKVNDSRVRSALDVVVEGVKLRDWALRDLRRRHARDLVDHMLTVQGRAATGAAGVLRTLSALAEDAIEDELLDVNPFKGVRVRPNDPRITKTSRKPTVYTWKQMHAFAAAAGDHELIIRLMSDLGLRVGEAIGADRRDLDGDILRIRGTVLHGAFIEGDSPTKRHVRDVPIPPGLRAVIEAAPRRDGTTLLCPTPTGRMWWARNFYRDVWDRVKALRVGDEPDAPLRFPDMQAATPHCFRHSWETHLHAAGIDGADLAEMAGHTLATMHARYVHSLGKSFDAVRRAVG